MPPYNELDPIQRGNFKFIRVADQLIIGDLNTAHREIVVKDGILDEVNRIRLQNRDLVDAGFVEITDTAIDLYEYSTWLGVTVKPKVRAKTVETFREQTTSREVSIKGS